MVQLGLFMIFALAILNGIFSPGLLMALVFKGLWYPDFLPRSPAMVFFFSSLLTATVTVMVSGIPAAIFERLSGAKEATPVSIGIWLAAMALLTLPALDAIRRAAGL